MPAETLLSAARRAVRFFQIDMNGHGGLMSVATQIVMDTLAREVEIAAATAKAMRGGTPTTEQEE